MYIGGMWWGIGVCRGWGVGTLTSHWCEVWGAGVERG